VLLWTSCPIWASTRALDLHGRCQLSSGSTSQKRLEKGAFLLSCEILVTTPAFPRRLDGGYPSSIVAGNHTLDGRGGDTNCPGNVLSFARSCQSWRDNLPALTAPGTLFPLDPPLYLLRGQMGGCTRNAVSHQLAFFPDNNSFLEYYTECISESFHTVSETSAKREMYRLLAHNPNMHRSEPGP
jgi:hypothetical protein